MLLMQEGTFSRAKTPTEVIVRASAAFAKDVSEVVGEMAQQFGANGMGGFKTALAEAGSHALADLAGRLLTRLNRR